MSLQCIELEKERDALLAEVQRAKVRSVELRREIEALKAENKRLREDAAKESNK